MSDDAAGVIESLIENRAACVCARTWRSETTDPVERLKLVICFALSGLHLTCRQAKPFNPILGETYQATFNDGTQVFCEQVSHHPPVTAWELIGPNGSYHFHGRGAWIASFRVNSVTGYVDADVGAVTVTVCVVVVCLLRQRSSRSWLEWRADTGSCGLLCSQQQGMSTIEFTDGTHIVFGPLPEVALRGILFGDRVMEYQGKMTFSYPEHNLSCEVAFNPDRGMLKWLRGASTPTDVVRGEIVRVRHCFRACGWCSS